MTVNKWPGSYSNSVNDGTEIIAEVERDDLFYEWSTVSILRRQIGDGWEYALYDDSGCSCNHAYEDSPATYDLSWEQDVVNVYVQARRAVQEWPNHSIHKESLRRQIEEYL